MQWSNVSYPLQRYCLEGDDSILSSLLRDYSNGVYVEVGANHPVNENVTFFLSEAGWTGLSIDATSSLSAEWEALRPHDTFIVSTIDSRLRNAKLVSYHDSTLNSIHPRAWKKAEEDSESIVSEEVASTRLLSEVIDEAGFDKIDLVSINARGADYDILLSLDVGRYRPQIIRVEMLYFNFQRPSDHSIYRLLTELGYSLVVKTLRNGFWIDPLAPQFSWVPEEMLFQIN